MTPEEYIKAYTRGCSNELVSVENRSGKKVISYHEWLTPENALAAVELAREEMMKDAIEGKVVAVRNVMSDRSHTYPWIELEAQLSKNDKVKVIIIKE